MPYWPNQLLRTRFPPFYHKFLICYSGHILSWCSPCKSTLLTWHYIYGKTTSYLWKSPSTLQCIRLNQLHHVKKKWLNKIFFAGNIYSKENQTFCIKIIFTGDMENEVTHQFALTSYMLKPKITNSMHVLDEHEANLKSIWAMNKKKENSY